MHNLRRKQVIHQNDEIIIANDVNLESLNDESNELIEAFESTEDTI